MAEWAPHELNDIGAAEEVRIASRRRDGTLRAPVTVWAVRVGDSIYIRSAVRGRNAAWYRGVEQTRVGRILAARIQKDVAFVDAGEGVNEEVDAAYHKKYRHYAGRILNSCLTPEARSTTLRLTPA